MFFKNLEVEYHFFSMKSYIIEVKFGRGGTLAEREKFLIFPGAHIILIPLCH
jgi:hypothetical protein